MGRTINDVVLDMLELIRENYHDIRELREQVEALTERR